LNQKDIISLVPISLFILLTFYYLAAYHSNSWHKHLAIGDEQAMALYQKNPNDTAIVEWENDMQSKFDIIDVECYDFTPSLYCYDLTNEARDDCLPHLYMPICEQYIVSPNLR
jgi:hypothetical protein